MGAKTVGGIDVIVQKKPSGGSITISLIDTESGFKVINVTGVPAAEIYNMGKIGEFVAELISGRIVSASIQPGALFQATVINSSRSNIKNN